MITYQPLSSERKKVALWCPFRGRVGTIEALIAYADVIKAQHDVILIQFTNEWEPYRHKLKGIRIENIWHSSTLNKVGQSNNFKRRDYYFLVLLSTWRLRKKMKTLQVDTVIGFLLIIPLLFASISENWKVIVSIQGTPSLFESQHRRGIFKQFENYLRLKLWTRLFRRRNLTLICMSDLTRRKIEKTFPNTKAVTICNALFDRMPQHTKCINTTTSTTKNLIFVGRLEYQKNPERFLEIFQELQRSSKFEWRAFLYGEGDLRKSLENLGLKNVFFKGHVESIWKSIARDQTVHLITSRWEDPGHAIIESLYHKIPTVIEDNGADYCNIYKDISQELVVSSNDVVKVLGGDFDDENLEYYSQKMYDIFSKEQLRRKILDHV